jgi:hypothetical protein
MAELYWLSEAEFSRIEPLLPRGRRGAHRVVWGALARLPGRIRPVYDDLQPFQPLEPPRGLAWDIRGADWQDGPHQHGLD